MTNREYHIDGLEFALKTFTALTAADTIAPTPTMIENALTNISAAAQFLREEQAAFDVLFVRDE